MASWQNFFSWYYTDGLRAVFYNGLHRTIGFMNYFSVQLLFATLFSPWHRIVESYGRGFDPRIFFHTLAGNIISRALGAIVRSLVIVMGLVVSFFAEIFGVLAMVFWIILPLLIPILFLGGILIIIGS